MGTTCIFSTTLSLRIIIYSWKAQTLRVKQHYKVEGQEMYGIERSGGADGKPSAKRMVVRAEVNQHQC